MMISKQKLRETIDTLSSWDRPLTENDYFTQHNILLHTEIEDRPNLPMGKAANPYIGLKQMSYNWIMQSPIEYTLKTYILYLREISDEYRKQFFTLFYKNTDAVAFNYSCLNKSNIADSLIETFTKFIYFDKNYHILSSLWDGLYKNSDGFIYSHFKQKNEFNCVIPMCHSVCERLVTPRIINILSHFDIKKYTLNMNGGDKTPEKHTYIYDDYKCLWQSAQIGE